MSDATDTNDSGVIGRLAFVGGSELTRDVLAYAMSEAGFVLEGNPGDEGVITLALTAEPHSLSGQSFARRTVLVTEHVANDDQCAELVLEGADAVISAQASAQELTDVLRTVAAGGAVVPPRAARRVLELARESRSGASALRTPLTRREIDILQCIGRGESVKETAATLGISAKTVENLQSRLFRKLDVRNRAQAFARAHSLGLLPS
jgi:DNA-binding NarL/FixJ family response regulator